MFRRTNTVLGLFFLVTGKCIITETETGMYRYSVPWTLFDRRASGLSTVPDAYYIRTCYIITLRYM